MSGMSGGNLDQFGRPDKGQPIDAALHAAVYDMLKANGMLALSGFGTQGGGASGRPPEAAGATAADFCLVALTGVVDTGDIFEPNSVDFQSTGASWLNGKGPYFTWKEVEQVGKDIGGAVEMKYEFKARARTSDEQGPARAIPFTQFHPISEGATPEAGSVVLLRRDLGQDGAAFWHFNSGYPHVFVASAVVQGGDAGDCDTPCSFIYSLEDRITGDSLANGSSFSPSTARIMGATYIAGSGDALCMWEPATDDVGGQPTLVLLAVLDERLVPARIHYVGSVDFDSEKFTECEAIVINDCGCEDAGPVAIFELCVNIGPALRIPFNQLPVAPTIGQTYVFFGVCYELVDFDLPTGGEDPDVPTAGPFADCVACADANINDCDDALTCVDTLGVPGPDFSVNGFSNGPVPALACAFNGSYTDISAGQAIVPAAGGGIVISRAFLAQVLKGSDLITISGSADLWCGDIPGVINRCDGSVDNIVKGETYLRITQMSAARVPPGSPVSGAFFDVITDGFTCVGGFLSGTYSFSDAEKCPGSDNTRCFSPGLTFSFNL